MLPGDLPLHFVRSVEDALELKRWLGERRPILAVDTETEGLHFERDALRLVQFGDTTAGWAVPWDDWKGFIRDTLTAYDGDVVGHNLRFDQRFLAHHAGVEFDPTRCHDTRVAAHLLAPDERTGLKWLAVKNIHPAADIGEKRLDEAMAKGKWNWATVPLQLEEYWAYAALDTVLTAQLHELLQPRLQQMRLTDLYELECAVSGVLLKMELRGCAVDVDYARRKELELDQYAQNLRTWCQENFGVSPGSNAAVIEILRNDGIRFTKRTKGGAYSLDAEVLEGIDHPLAQTVLWVRQSEKLAHTYFMNIVDMQRDGVLHCNINQLGARTGRMSITEPALQTLPRSDGASPIVRDAFIPFADQTLFSADFDQIEMKLFAHFAGEEEMIRKMIGGIDFHTITAQAAYQLGDGLPTKPQRQIAKNANFCRIYGGGPKKFAETAGITEKEAFDFYRNYDTAYPGAKRFAREVDQVVAERFMHEGKGYVRAPSGRIHPALEDREYACVNYLVQGTAADVFKQSLVNLDMSGLGDLLTLPVHDEVILSVPPEDADDVAATVKDVMEDRTHFRVPLTVGVEGPMERWGDKFR